MHSKAFNISKVGFDYIGNLAISQVCSGHDAFIIQSALLDYSFPFLILVCYIRLVYCTSNFQIVAIARTSLVKDTFPLQLNKSNSKFVLLASKKRIKVLGIGNSFLY